MMDIGFVWDENKYNRARQKHDITFCEVISAFEDEVSIELPDPAGHVDRFMLLGETVTNRVMMVIFSEEELPLYRIITALDAPRRWLNEYQKRRAGI